MTITSCLFDAYLKCPTKCWLRSQGEAGEENAYAHWIRTQNESYRSEGTKRLLEGMPQNEHVIAPPAAGNPKSAKWRLGVDLLAQTQDLESRLHAVERVPSEGRGKPARFVPSRLVFVNKLTKDDKLLIAFDALVFSEVIGREVSLGRIIHGDDYATLKVKTPGLMGGVRNRVEKMRALLSSSSPPDVILNRHCAECEFQTRCRQKAMEKDDLSLLANMTEKERKKYHGKGIFTVTQLSYTFRPRRRPKRLRGKRERYHHSLKALAIREQKIHIVGNPELKIDGTPVYLDVEGLPDRDFYYLIGMLIRNGDSILQHSLWADNTEDEKRIWSEFLGILENVRNPVVIHYGSYETIFLKRMCERYAKPADGSVSAKALASPLNLPSAVFARIYFPTYRNSLKDLARFLGFKWSETTASGLYSLAWRYDWERSHEPKLKQMLIAYNADDCEALRRITVFLASLCGPEQHESTDHSKKVVHTDSLPKPRLFGFGKAQFQFPELEEINRAAYWDYQRERVLVRSNHSIRRSERR